MERLKRILEIGIGSFICLMLLTVCTDTTVKASGFNKQLFDLNYNFTKCITWCGDKTIEIEVDKWTDYEDGEQIQILGKDGNVYLVSSMNSILINEK